MRIYENGTFISCEDNNRIFSILIEDKGKIIFIGNDIPEKYNKIKERVNLEGRCVLPAFIDTHIHFSQFSFLISGANISDSTTIEELCETLTNYVHKNPKDKSIIAFGCSENSLSENRMPIRKELDKVTSKPLMIVGATGHSSVANSALINMFPMDIRNDSGFYGDTGLLYKTAFLKASDFYTKFVSPLAYLKSLSKGADYLAKQGISLVHSVEGSGIPLDLDVDSVRMASSFLPQDFRVYFQTMNIHKVTRRRMKRIGGCFATALDGSFGTQDAALIDPYDNDSTNKGVLFYPQNKVTNFVKNANRKGLQVSLHAIGDAAIEQALVAYEEALKDCPRNDHRHVIIHAELPNIKQLERAAKLGIHFAVQTQFLHWKHEPSNYLNNLLGHRITRNQPIKTMINYGLNLGNGSDGPCVMPNTIEAIYSACNHPNPNERVSVLEAIKMSTNWASKLAFDENSRGTLSEGKLCDLVVLDKNPLITPIDKLNEIKVCDLYLKGKRYLSK